METINTPTRGRLSALCAAIIPALYCLSACSIGVSPDGPETSIDRISFIVEDFRVADDGPQTRTSIQNGSEFIWAAGDTVGIYPDTGAQIYFAMESGAGASAASFDGGGWAFKSSALYYSYYPFIGDTSVDEYPFEVSTDQSGDGYEASDLLFAKAVKVSRTDGAVALQFHHILSKLVVKVEKGEKFEGEIPDDIVSHIYNTNVECAVSLNTCPTQNVSAHPGIA